MLTGMTGTVIGLTDAQMKVANPLVKALSGEFHHGDCVGADLTLARLAKNCGLFVVAHPPTVDKKRAFHTSDLILPPLPYLARNQKIVDSVDMMFVFPKKLTEELRSGTWATVRYARKKKKMLVIVWPDGTISHENHH